MAFTKVGPSIAGRNQRRSVKSLIVANGGCLDLMADKADVVGT
jgi:hypothetical protein